MAPTKKRGAPASASKSVRSGKKPLVDSNWKPTSPQQGIRVAHRLALLRAAEEALIDAAPYDGEYTEELGQLMAAMVADGMTLDAMDALDKLPPRRAVLKWLTDKDHPFYTLYYEAKRMLVPLYEERAQTVAASALEGITRTKRQVVTKDGDIVDVEEERTSDNVERSKLIVSTLQWSLAHLSPKKHGRNADNAEVGKNEQLEGLFAALKAGPVKS